MRYLAVIGDKFLLHLVAAIRKFDGKADITLVATDREVLVDPTNSVADHVLEGVESLSRINLKSIDVVVVHLESISNPCELGRELKRSGIPIIVAATTSSGEIRDFRGCGYNFLIPIGRFIESAVGSIVGLDTWVELPTRTFASINLKTYRVFRRARLGVTLKDIASEVRDTRGLTAIYDKDGNYVTSSDYVLTEGDLIVAAAPTERDVVVVVERLNKLFMLAERVYTALESRRPPG